MSAQVKILLLFSRINLLSHLYPWAIWMLH